MFNAKGQVECPMPGAHYQAFTSTNRRLVSASLHGVKKVPIPHEPAERRRLICSGNAAATI
jgi:hypothetical protein